MPTPYTLKDPEFWKISISLGLASIFIFAFLYPLQPILPVLAREFKVSTTVVSLTMSFSIIGLIIGLNVLGMLTDRYGRRSFVLGSLFLSVITFLLIPMTHSFTLIIILRFIQGFAVAALPASALAYMGEEIAKRDLKIAVSIYIAANAFGGMLGRIATGMITEHYSWQTAFFILGSAGAAVSLLIAFILPKSRFFRATQGSFKENLKGFAFHLKNNTLLRYFGIGFMIQMTYSAVWTYLPFYLEGPPFYLSVAAIGSLYLALICGVPSAPIAGFLANRIQLKTILFFALGILAFGTLLTAIPSIWIVMIGLCFVSFGMIAAHSLAAALVNEHATEFRGTASSLYFVAYYIGAAVGSTLFAPIWENLSWRGIVLISGALPLFYMGFLALFPSKSDRAP